MFSKFGTINGIGWDISEDLIAIQTVPPRE